MLSIADDIRARGHAHSCIVHLLQPEKATPDVAQSLGLRCGARVFHSIIVHLEDGWPIQLEDRYVNPLVAPVERVEHKPMCRRLRGFSPI